MKQYNLLVVSGEQKTNALVVGTCTRYKRVKFAFQASSPSEARLLLERLNIDILLLDLDQSEHDIREFNRDCPKTTVWAMAQNPRTALNKVDPLRNIVLVKNDLPAVLRSEIKLLDKANGTSFFQSLFDSKKQAGRKQARPLGVLAKQ